MATHRFCRVLADDKSLVFEEVKRVIGLANIKFIEPPQIVYSTIKNYFNSEQVRDVSELLGKSPHGSQAIELMQRLTEKSIDCVYVVMSTAVNSPKLMMFYTLQRLIDSMSNGPVYYDCDSLYGCVLHQKRALFITARNVDVLPTHLRNFSQNECSVCLEEIVNPRLIEYPYKCKHWLCKNCLDACNTKECPLCREVTPQQNGSMVKVTYDMNADLPLMLAY